MKDCKKAKKGAARSKIAKTALGTSVFVGSYLYGSAPNPKCRKRMSGGCIAFAHRGLYGADIPENSLAAFRAAVEHGFAIELDVRQSADGTLYVFHDDDLKRMCKRDKLFSQTHDREIDSLTLGNTEHHIPRFRDVLSLVDGKVPLLVELKADMKDTTLCPAVNRMLEGYGGKYYIESFNSFLLKWYAKNRPDVVRGQLYTDVYGMSKKLGLFADSMLINFLSRPDFIAYDIRHSDKPLLNLCLKVFRPRRFVWTVRDNETYNKYYNDGMTDGIIFEGFVPGNGKK